MCKYRQINIWVPFSGLIAALIKTGWNRIASAAKGYESWARSKIRSLRTQAKGTPAIQPNGAASKLLGSRAFQRRALVEGAECAEMAEALLTAAGGKTGGILSISPAEGAATVRHPTNLGEVAESVHHQVFTDGNFVFDPLYSPTPISRPQYEALIRQLNGPAVEIGFFPAQP